MLPWDTESAMKSLIINAAVLLLYFQVTSGAALAPLLGVPSNSIAADGNTHCSNDYASYGQQYPGSVACILATHDMLQDRAFTTLPSMYPIEFISSKADSPALGNGIRTPRRYSYGEGSAKQFSRYLHMHTD